MAIDSMIAIVFLVFMIQVEEITHNYGYQLKQFVVDRLMIRSHPSHAFKTRICPHKRSYPFAFKFRCSKYFHWYQGGQWESVCLTLFEGRSRFPPRRYRLRFVCGWKRLPIVDIQWEIKR